MAALIIIQDIVAYLTERSAHWTIAWQMINQMHLLHPRSQQFTTMLLLSFLIGISFKEHTQERSDISLTLPNIVATLLRVSFFGRVAYWHTSQFASRIGTLLITTKALLWASIKGCSPQILVSSGLPFVSRSYRGASKTLIRHIVPSTRGWTINLSLSQSIIRYLDHTHATSQRGNN